MSPEWISALAAVLSLLIIAVSALAALRQVDHIRISNQSQTFMSLAALMQTPEFRESAIYVLAGNLDKACDEIGDPPDPMVLARAMKPALPVFHAFEAIGACVVYKMLDSKIIAGTYNPVPFWQRSVRFIDADRRLSNNPKGYDKFEALTALVQSRPERPLPKMDRR